MPLFQLTRWVLWGYDFVCQYHLLVEDNNAIPVCVYLFRLTYNVKIPLYRTQRHTKPGAILLVPSRHVLYWPSASVASWYPWWLLHRCRTFPPNQRIICVSLAVHIFRQFTCHLLSLRISLALWFAYAHSTHTPHLYSPFVLTFVKTSALRDQCCLNMAKFRLY